MEVGMEENTETPFSMKIELRGEFRINEREFPIDKIDDWARKNAPLILLPYLREQAFSLTARCGFKPLVLPLFVVPTFSIGANHKGS